MPITDPIKKAEYNREYQVKNRESIYKKHREWVEKNKEHDANYHKEYHKRWYEKNKEKRKAQLKEYQQGHKKEAVLSTQKYTAKNKDKVYAYGRMYNQTINGKYRLYSSAAEKRGYEFSLSAQEFGEVISKPCTYCGEESSKMGVDRIDNSIGYTTENSTSCCKMCNYMKNKHSVEDFLTHAKKITQHNSR